MTGRQVGVVGVALVAVGALAASMWPHRGPAGACAVVAEAQAVAQWRGVAVRAEVRPTPNPSAQCRTAWTDARRPDRTLLELSIHRAAAGPGDLGAREPTGEVDRMGRAGVEVTVRRTPQRRAIVVVPIATGEPAGDDVWAEIVIHDEQQGDVVHWVDAVLARRDDVLDAVATAGAGTDE